MVRGSERADRCLKRAIHSHVETVIAHVAVVPSLVVVVPNLKVAVTRLAPAGRIFDAAVTRRVAVARMLEVMVTLSRRWVTSSRGDGHRTRWRCPLPRSEDHRS